MNINEVILCLNSDLRLKILQCLSKKDMTTTEIYNMLKNKIKYRQYVHRELENLKDCRLVTKYYDDSNKRIYYHLNHEKLLINLKKMEINYLE